jgi:16S rRNA C967 or C1407 C5-methylase (RsmB/RsmF family)/NOL1/NOP2/fmu family ribosome biogenesis protein
MHPIPIEFSDRILRQFPTEADAFLNALHDPPVTSVRMNSSKPCALLPEATAIPWNTEGYFLRQRPRFTFDPLFHAGCYYPQESSSMVLQWVLKHVLSKDAFVDALDLCAAPGGKSLILSDFLGSKGRLIANEIVRSRAQILSEVVTKWGCRNVAVTNNRPTDFAESEMQFDLMLIDAPCSGEGMFRKDPEARGEWNAGSAAMCSKRQSEILNDVLPALRENGILIYSTCTFATEENEGIISSLLAGGEYESLRWPVPPEWNVSVIDEQGIFAMRFLPHRVSGEGFFIAALRKISNAPVKRGKPKNVFRAPAQTDINTLRKWQVAEGHIVLAPDGDLYQSVFTIQELNTWAASLYFLSTGVQLGKIVRGELIPAHALAHAQRLLPMGDCIELNASQAMSYLRGEAIQVEAPNGWRRVAFQGQTLGWIKVIGNRINNYYPKEWRVKLKE